MAQEDPWYQQLRTRWKPANVRLLLIGESAPDDHGDPLRRRFFYSSSLTQYDNLFRGVVDALYDTGRLDSRTETKVPWLEHLRDDGVFLIDLVAFPVNANGFKLSRAGARRAAVTDCVERAQATGAEGVIICHAPTYRVLAGPLRTAGMAVLHDEPLPFPSGNKRAEFVEKFRTAAAVLDNATATKSGSL